MLQLGLFGLLGTVVVGIHHEADKHKAYQQPSD
jgi:hypothetical protein